MKILNLACCLLLIFCSIHLAAQVVYQDINGQNLNIGTIINWTTLEEEHVKHFIVEKSVNGVQYFPVFECTAQKGEESTTNYSFLDIKTNSSIAYYRIKEQLLDDTYSYSKVIAVSQNFQNNLLVEEVSDISDSAEQGILSVYYSSLISGRLTYSIEDETNTLLSKETKFVFTGPNLLAVDFSLFPKGTYSLKMQIGEEVELILFEKQGNQLNFEVNNDIPRSYTVKSRQD
ncbi:MAG: hypothetical protein AB8G86_16740 [Saprospiraceae bacterium]